MTRDELIRYRCDEPDCGREESVTRALARIPLGWIELHVCPCEGDIATRHLCDAHAADCLARFGISEQGPDDE